MLVSIAEHIGAAIGATPTTGGLAVSFAVTIQRTSGSATTDSGGITDSLTRRAGGAHRPLGTSSWAPSSDRDSLTLRSRRRSAACIFGRVGVMLSARRPFSDSDVADVVSLALAGLVQRTDAA